jgi:hypothetical protein
MRVERGAGGHAEGVEGAQLPRVVSRWHAVEEGVTGAYRVAAESATAANKSSWIVLRRRVVTVWRRPLRILAGAQPFSYNTSERRRLRVNESRGRASL